MMKIWRKRIRQKCHEFSDWCTRNAGAPAPVTNPGNAGAPALVTHLFFEKYIKLLLYCQKMAVAAFILCLNWLV